MSEPRFDIYFRGECLQNFQAEQVKHVFCQIFKAPAEKINPLFSGKPVALKKALDKATAIKFKQAFEKAGAKVYVQLSQANSQVNSIQTAPARPSVASMFELLPPGSDVLSHSEKSAPVITKIDIAHLSTQTDYQRLSPISEAAPEAPDVSYITVAEAGADLLAGYKTAKVPTMVLDLSAIELAEVGADMNPAKKPTSPAAPDVSHITLSN